MTRDELETELETLLIGTPKMSDVMAAVDAHVAQRVEEERRLDKLFPKRSESRAES